MRDTRALDSLEQRPTKVQSRGGRRHRPSTRVDGLVALAVLGGRARVRYRAGAAPLPPATARSRDRPGSRGRSLSLVAPVRSLSTTISPAAPSSRVPIAARRAGRASTRHSWGAPLRDARTASRCVRRLRDPAQQQARGTDAGLVHHQHIAAMEPRRQVRDPHVVQESRTRARPPGGARPRGAGSDAGRSAPAEVRSRDLRVAP